MLPVPQPSESGANLSYLSDERTLALFNRSMGYQATLLRAGVEGNLAQQAADILTYKAIPWSKSDQAIVRRAFKRLLEGQEGE